MFAEYGVLLGETFKDIWYGEVRPFLSNINYDSPLFWAVTSLAILAGLFIYKRL